MTATFVELPAFARYRSSCLTDAKFRELQILLLKNPRAGAVISETGGLRKLRFGEAGRQSGKRGGLRVIYYWWADGGECWLFTLYAKRERTDLSQTERRRFRTVLESELNKRRRR